MPQENIPSQIINYLKSHSIDFIHHTHEAVFTCEAAEKVSQNIKGIPAKTLILKESKKQNFFMIVLPSHKRLEIKTLQPILQVKKASFASAEYLEKLLKVTPGSCSPFGIIFDQDQKIKIYIDEEIINSDHVNFHPNINTDSLELTQENFQNFLNSIPHRHQIITL